MANLLLNDDGDLDIQANNFVVNSGLQAIQQHLQSRLRFFLGEWFLDVTLGVPYFQSILVKKAVFPVVINIFKQTILNTPGVNEIDTFEVNLDAATRELTVEFTAITEEGGVLDFTGINAIFVEV